MQAIIQNTHRRMDYFTRGWLQDYRASGGVIYCARGCANCCYMAVHATFPEAACIAGGLTPPLMAQLDVYVEGLTALSEQLRSMPDYLKKHREKLPGCPFLVDSVCDIYPLRPLSCRSLLSTKPAEWCAVDLAQLDAWDRQLYEQSLDLQTVAWPTHYVASCQDFGRNLEQDLLEKMHERCGWSLSGNLPLMVWLEKRYRLSNMTVGAINGVFAELPFDHGYLLFMHTAGEPTHQRIT